MKNLAIAFKPPQPQLAGVFDAIQPCPTCGGPLHGTEAHVDMLSGWFVTKRGTVHLTPTEATILDLLVKRREASYSQIVDTLYGLLPDGGPDDPKNVLMTCVCKLRKKIRGLDFRIVTSVGFGYALLRATDNEMRRGSDA